MCSICDRFFKRGTKLDVQLLLAVVGEAMEKLPHKVKHDAERAHLEEIIGTALGLDEGKRDKNAERIFEERRYFDEAPLRRREE
jgi:hypothetical protein